MSNTIITSFGSSYQMASFYAIRMFVTIFPKVVWYNDWPIEKKVQKKNGQVLFKK